MSKKQKRKTHQRKDGKLLQTNKKFSHLKRSQQERINEWLYNEYRRIYADINLPPDSRYNDEILCAVNEKIEKARIWLPFNELRKYFISKKVHFRKRYEREINRNIENMRDNAKS